MDFSEAILQYFKSPAARAQRPRQLANELGVDRSDLADFKQTVERLLEAGRLRLALNGTVRLAGNQQTIVGTIRRSGRGAGSFSADDPAQIPEGHSVYLHPEDVGDAFTGDRVEIVLLKRPGKAGQRLARVVQVLSRASNTFVGSYREERGKAFVQLDGSLADLFVSVGDPGAKGAAPGDQVVVELIHFPKLEAPGEGVITEVLGRRGEPGVDLRVVLQEFGLTEEFPEAVVEDARRAAQEFNDGDVAGRTDLTGETIITIDPVDARDFDDAISLAEHADGTWRLGVHIADVSTFVPTGSAIDAEARRRGTSVYLPDKVIPMLPELISNGLASLQQGKLRYTKSVFIEMEPGGTTRHIEFANSAIRTARRFAYEEVIPLLDGEPGCATDVTPEVMALLQRMRRLARILRARRMTRGALDLALPEVKIDLSREGVMTGAHRVVNDESHQIIEEFMLAANVAVARSLAERELPFLRRAHPAPDERKLKGLADFAKGLGYQVPPLPGRSAMQDLLAQAKGKPTELAVSFSLLRSLKQADYRPAAEGHFALAEEDYCHFTSPIRRYPDLTIHRLLDEIIRQRPQPKHLSESELVKLGEWCSQTERQAADAERELIKLKILGFMTERVGMELTALVTGVERFGLFCLGQEFPAEGLVHISQLPDDTWDYDGGSHTLVGRRKGGILRLGDQVRVKVARVDQVRRLLQFDLISDPPRMEGGTWRPSPAPHSGRSFHNNRPQSKSTGEFAAGGRQGRTGKPAGKKSAGKRTKKRR